MIGYYGSVQFTVSSDFVRTFHSLTEKRSGRYAIMDILNGQQKIQYTGKSLPEITIEINFASDIVTPQGTDVQAELKALRRMVDSGDAFSLVIGTKSFGRFVCLGMTGEWKRVDNRGRLTAAGATVQMQAYN